MPKKHRVKRQNYVAHLLNLEKQREAFLEKRRAPKRSRASGNEGATNALCDRTETVPAKKQRTEAGASGVARSMSEDGAAPLPSAPMAATKSAAATEAAVAKAAFFSTAPFDDVAKASAAAAQAANAPSPDAPVTATTAKRTLRRRHY
ncbi:hypothetical protein LSCM1_01847 [Leishmania martiniquensis]|uniref:Uncharacterized protein n=1 Tax=Leishmania martiniquensis TaxID=1580590 RepID=A0A836KE70_9TRYP|nr:hypothetical protein LSCM1_01847 [Leishmania martiniquensis]